MVKLRDSLAHLTGGESHHGICACVVLGIAVKYFDSERTFLQVARPALQGRIDHIFQKRRVALAAAKVIAG